MKQKKETILSVLDSGTKEIVYHGKEYDEIKVTTSNGVYQFPEDLRDSLLSSQKHYERIEKNLREYGHYQGKAGVCKPNKTEIVLAELSTRKYICPKLYAMYRKCIEAPRHLQNILFDNLKHWLSAENKDFSLNFSTKYPITFDIISCLPKAWVNDWESVNLFGWDTKCQLEDLTPAAGLEIGAKVCVPWQGKKNGLFEGKIIGYAYLGERVCHGYGNSLQHSGRKVLWYDVQVGDNKWNHAPFRLKEISFNVAASV